MIPQLSSPLFQRYCSSMGWRSRRSLLLLVFATVSLLIGHSSASADEAAAPQNVILIMTDDQGYGDLGFHGNPIVQTPHLDRLAENSARLPNFVVSPVCTPTRASLMTGRYNYRTRAIDTFRGRAMMEPDEITVAEVLSANGFATGLFGKWHLGDNYPLRPVDQGFEEALGHLGGGLAQASDHWDNNRRYTDAILFHNGEPFQSTGYCTDVYFDAAIDWITKSKNEGRRSFTYIATNAPHAPWHDVPPKWYEYYQKQTISVDSLNLDEGYPNYKERPIKPDDLARYYAMISNIDDNLGRLIDTLADLNLLEDTLLIFMTDNGPAPSGYVAGYRGKKGLVYDGGIRSPFFVHWPAGLEAGEKSSKIAAHIDVMPTILDAVGLSTPSDRKIDGRSILPLLKSADISDWPDREIVLQSHRGNHPAAEHHFCVRTDRWKLLRNSGFRNETPGKRFQFELFDLSVDPYEMHDVAADNPEVVARLKGTYQDWFRDVSSTRENNYQPPRIHINPTHEPRTVLSRQDRRDSGKNDPVGHWLISVDQAATYAVDIVLLDQITDGALEVTIGEQSHSRSISDDAALAFDLPTGPAKLTAKITSDDGKAAGVDYVMLKRQP